MASSSSGQDFTDLDSSKGNNDADQSGMTHRPYSMKMKLQLDS